MRQEKLDEETVRGGKQLGLMDVEEDGEYQDMAAADFQPCRQQ
jgi:hypothetical protein